LGQEGGATIHGEFEDLTINEAVKRTYKAIRNVDGGETKTLNEDLTGKAQDFSGATSFEALKQRQLAEKMEA
jgi:hypothetical protein